MRIVAGIDLGGTAINYTFVDESSRILIAGLCEHPARAREGPAVCIDQMVEGLVVAAGVAGIPLGGIAAAGLGTPGAASADGVLSRDGSTNFEHAGWSGFGVREALERRLGIPVYYLNDGNAAALWGHFSLFGAGMRATSVSAIVGTGFGGGIITEGLVVRGRNGYGGELGHVLLPWQSIPGVEGLDPRCNCGRTGDPEALCSLTAIENSLLPYFLARRPDHPLGKVGDLRKAARMVRGLAEAGDEMALAIFRVQAHALGLLFDQTINIFDPDALIVGGGAIETGDAFRAWFIREIRAAMPRQLPEQAAIPIRIMPDGDCAGARGAAIEALRQLQSGQSAMPVPAAATD